MQYPTYNYPAYGYPAPMQQFPLNNGNTYQPMQQNVQSNIPQSGMEVVPVQTIQQVEQVGLQPGQRKMVMVQNEPVIAARYADNMGLVTTEYYHLEKFTPGTMATSAPSVDYVTRQEFDAFVESLKSTPKVKKGETE